MKSLESKSVNGRDAANDDIDISLIEINLRLSYEDRIQKHENARQLAQELRNAGRRLSHAKPTQLA